jgi:hypothetical protein
MEELIVDCESGYLDSTDVKLALQKAINGILEVIIAFLELLLIVETISKLQRHTMN